MKKIANFLTIIILLESILYSNSWQQKQKFFDKMNTPQKSTAINQKANFNIDNIINALNTNNRSISTINGYNGSISGAVSSWTNNSNAQESFSNITTIINNTQKH